MLVSSAKEVESPTSAVVCFLWNAFTNTRWATPLIYSMKCMLDEDGS